MPEKTVEGIVAVTDALRDILIDKNAKYGDSALHPLKTFSKGDASNSLCIRIDDKLSRIANSGAHDQDDVFDLMGYLVLLSVSMGWTEYNGEEKLGEDDADQLGKDSGEWGEKLWNLD